MTRLCMLTYLINIKKLRVIIFASLMVFLSPMTFANTEIEVSGAPLYLKPNIKVKTIKKGGIAGGGSEAPVAGFVIPDECPTVDTLREKRIEVKEFKSPLLRGVLENLRDILDSREDLNELVQLHYYKELTRFIEGSRKILKVDRLCVRDGNRFVPVYAATTNIGGAGGISIPPIYITSATLNPKMLDLYLVEGESKSEFIDPEALVQDAFLKLGQSQEEAHEDYIKFRIARSILHELTHEVIINGVFTRKNNSISEKEEDFVVEFTDLILGNQSLEGFSGRGWGYMKGSDRGALTEYGAEAINHRNKEPIGTEKDENNILRVSYEEQGENPCDDLIIEGKIRVFCDKSITVKKSRRIVNPKLMIRNEKLNLKWNNDNFCKVMGRIDGNGYNGAVFRSYNSAKINQVVTFVPRDIRKSLPKPMKLEKAQALRSVYLIGEITCIKAESFSSHIPSSSHEIVSLGDGGHIKKLEDIERNEDGSITIRRPMVQLGDRLIPFVEVNIGSYLFDSSDHFCKYIEYKKANPESVKRVQVSADMSYVRVSRVDRRNLNNDILEEIELATVRKGQSVFAIDTVTCMD